MNKVAARKRALEDKITIGELRSAISTSRSRGGFSTVNPAVMLDRALDIYEAALAGRDDAEVPAAWQTDPYSYTNRMKPSYDVLLITNILRDCL